MTAKLINGSCELQVAISTRTYYVPSMGWEKTKEWTVVVQKKNTGQWARMQSQTDSESVHVFLLPFRRSIQIRWSRCLCAVNIFHSSRDTVCAYVSQNSLLCCRNSYGSFSLCCGRSICFIFFFFHLHSQVICYVIRGPSTEKKGTGVQPMWREMYGFKFHDVLLPLPWVLSTFFFVGVFFVAFSIFFYDFREVSIDAAGDDLTRP